MPAWLPLAPATGRHVLVLLCFLYDLVEGLVEVGEHLPEAVDDSQVNNAWSIFSTSVRSIFAVNVTKLPSAL